MNIERFRLNEAEAARSVDDHVAGRMSPRAVGCGSCRACGQAALTHAKAWSIVCAIPH